MARMSRDAEAAARQDGPEETAAPAARPAGEAFDPMRLALALTLTMISGFVDAIGYIHLGNINLSFMSGNSVGLAIALPSWKVASLVATGTVIGSFVAGAFAGTLIAGPGGHPRRVTLIILCEAVLCAAALGFTLGRAGTFALLPIAAAMGMQNALHQALAGVDVGQSFVTGTLFRLGQHLALLLRSGVSRRETAILMGSWLIFVAGAIAGSVVLLRYGLDPALALALGLLGVAAACALAWQA